MFGSKVIVAVQRSDMPNQLLYFTQNDNAKWLLAGDISVADEVEPSEALVLVRDYSAVWNVTLTYALVQPKAELPDTIRAACKMRA